MFPKFLTATSFTLFIAACQPAVFPVSGEVKIYNVGGHEVAVVASELENRYVAYHYAAAERTKTGDDFLGRNLDAIRIATNCHDLRLISNTNGKTEVVTEC